MAFVTRDGQTEQETGRVAMVDGIPVHYHDVGAGEPIVFLHSYGPGSNAWITWFRVLPYFVKRYRCIMLDLANYGKTGPIVFREPIHYVHARLALGLMDSLGIEKAHIVGNSQGGQAAFVFAYRYPHRTAKLVWGAGHIGTAYGYRNEYLLAVHPEQGAMAAMQAVEEPSSENFRRYLEQHIWDPSLVTEELVEYVRTNYFGSPEIRAAAQECVSEPYDHSEALASLDVPNLIIWGRQDRMCMVEIGINALNLTPNSQLVVFRDTGHWVPFERPAEYAGHVLTFLRGYALET
ncbi:alpha/beta fold hydrolase [Nocardia sp. R6R-6]|uniref:alpha/beta fold hydrolase n=1 Tax=Nocardia sp. R6R-6 TaxID=3459303 RepID=UPI00403E1B0C